MASTTIMTAKSPVNTADCIKRMVDSAPPLTKEQRDRLAALLKGGCTR